MFSGTCVLLFSTERIRGMARASVYTATATFIPLFPEVVIFAFSIFALAILAGLIATASWRLQSLCMFAHVFP